MPPPLVPVGGVRMELPQNPEDAVEVFIEGNAVRIPKGFFVLQACEVTDVDILPKPIASCAMPASQVSSLLLLPHQPRRRGRWRAGSSRSCGRKRGAAIAGVDGIVEKMVERRQKRMIKNRSRCVHERAGEQDLAAGGGDRAS